MARQQRKAVPPTNRQTSSVRIIGGSWRGRKLPVCEQPGLRPTPDRVRETLFNWLSAWVPGSHCLDCFSGSGALALEALSRGAEQAVMYDANPVAANQLSDNLQLLNADNGTVHNADILQRLTSQADHRYDLVFLDPPFRQQLLLPCCQLLEDNGWLTDDAMIYVEVEHDLPLNELPQGWRLYREKQAGQVSYRLYQRQL